MIIKKKLLLVMNHKKMRERERERERRYSIFLIKKTETRSMARKMGQRSR